MKTGYTKVAVLLDRSGSMEGIRMSMIGAFNEFIKGLRSQPGECDVMLAQFDEVNNANSYEVVFDKALADVPALSVDTYVPRGGTPLYDSMARLITEFGQKLKDTDEHLRPEHVVVVIITDGQENASHVYSAHSNGAAKIKAMVEHQINVYKWVFNYFGANQDAIHEAGNIGISHLYAVNFDPNHSSVQNMSAGVASFTNCVRSGVAHDKAASATYTSDYRKQTAKKS